MIQIQEQGQMAGYYEHRNEVQVQVLQFLS
jgi:hypothetical protein